MPTILFENGFRFFFYSRENNEPAHVHLAKGNAEGKIWLEPIMQVAYFIKFTNSEQQDIMEIARANYQNFKQRWYEYFKK